MTDSEFSLTSSSDDEVNFDHKTITTKQKCQTSQEGSDERKDVTEENNILLRYVIS